jgi:hypothetical protein
MNATTESLIGQFLEPIFRTMSPATAEAIIKLTAASDLQDRIEYLAQQTNEGGLSEQEQDEYQAFIDAGDILATLQAIARKTLPNLHLDRPTN